MFLQEFIKDDVTNLDNNQQQKNYKKEEQHCMNNLNQCMIKNTAFTKQLGHNDAKYDYQEVDFTSFQYEYDNNHDNIINKNSKTNSIGSSIYDLMIEPDFIDFENLQDSSEQDQNEQIIEITDLCERVNDEKIEQQNEENNINKNQFDTTESPPENFQLLDIKEISDYIPSIPIQPYSEIINLLQLPEYLKEFLQTPLQHQGMFQCIIQRNISGLNAFTPKYKLYWQKNKQFLLSAKRSFKGHKYKISQDSEFSTFFEPTLLGRVEQGKQSKGDYFLFNNGKNIKDNKKSSITNNQKIQLGGVFYEAKSTKEKQPRKMTVLLKQNGDEKNINTFVNRTPVLKQQFNQYVHTLDFFGRAKYPSVKNTQLVNKTEKNDIIYLLVGKRDDQTFHLDFMNPFSPLLAFQVALTIFDYQQH